MNTEKEVWQFLYDDANKFLSEEKCELLMRWTISGICAALSKLWRLRKIDKSIYRSCEETIQSLPEKLFHHPRLCAGRAMYLGRSPGKEGVSLRIEVLRRLISEEGFDDLNVSDYIK